MADKVTSTKSASADPNDKINKLLDQAKEAMVEAGMPPDQADAMLNAARPNGGETAVGNLADLQRMGAIQVSGTIPTPPGQDDVETSDISEAFQEAPQGRVEDIDQDRLAYAHRLPDVTKAQELADEQHAAEGTAVDTTTSTTSSKTKADAETK